MLDSGNDIYINPKISNYIPITCHYDPNTLITKNGDLIQIVAISGFEPNDTNFNSIPLREVIRSSIASYIKDNKVAVYIHTLNNFSNIEIKANFSSEFAKNINDKWSEFNQWSSQLLATVYISIVIQGAKKSPFNPQQLHEILFFHFYKKHHLKELEEARIFLSEISNNIIKSSSRFGAKLLGIKKDKESNKYYSEPLSFIYNLIHLKQKDIELEPCDASEQLASLKINYYFNKIELEEMEEESNKTFVAVFSFKPFHDLSIEDCTAILEHNFKYIISESVVFTPRAIAIKEIKKQANFLEAGRNERLLAASYIDKLISAEMVGKTDYCERQINLILYSQSAEELDNSIEKIMQIFEDIGILLVREDFYMPLCFWSIIPSNFQYSFRKNYNLAKFSSTFAFVPSTSMGSYNGSKWGPPVALFKNRKRLPYYFNFHQNDNGHTMIVGPEESGKEILLKFLLSSAVRLNPRIIFLDLKGNNEKFISKLGGQSFKVSAKDSPIFKIGFGDDEKTYTKNVFCYLIFGTLTVSAAEENVLNSLINHIENKTSIYEALKEFAVSLPDAVIKEKINYLNENFIKIFEGPDSLEVLKNNKYVGIDFSLLEKKYSTVLLRLLISKLPEFLDDTPTIIAVNSDFRIFEKQVLVEKLLSSLEKLNAKNAIIIFTFNYNKELYDNFQFFEKVIYNIPTRIFLPNKLADKSFKKTFKLSEEDFYNIRNYARGKLSFLLKQYNKSVNILFDLESIKEIKEDLS
ncbi:MAG: Type IV secretory pathway, VirB4 component [Candidatus Midichloria mitochondrii]